jgi:hypothetical protein
MGALNRRALFGAVPAAAALAVPVTVAALPSSAGLERLGQHWEATRIEAERINADYDRAQAKYDAYRLLVPCGMSAEFTARKWAEIGQAKTESGLAECEERWDAVQDRLMVLERQIIDAPCRNVADAQIKARVALANPDNDFGSDAARSVADFVLKMGAH